MTINPYARQARNYREHDILNADPVKLVVLTYDAAIAACGRKDLGTATRAIHELIKSLDFDQGDLPVRLLALYQWTSDECRSGRWDSAACCGHTGRGSRQSTCTAPANRRRRKGITKNSRDSRCSWTDTETERRR